MPDTFTRQDMNPHTPPAPLDPTLYHAHHVLRADDLPFWQSLAKEYDGPVLELGCGTGRILLTLTGESRRLTGLDTDPNMLVYLRETIPSQALANVNIIHADMRTFDLPERFALVILPCNTYSTFTAPEREQIARTVRRHLQPGGVFAFSVPNPHLIASLDPIGEFDIEDSFLHPHTGHSVEVFSRWERTPETITFTWRYDQHYLNGNTIPYTTSTCHQLDTPEMYLEELQRANLTPIALYGDYQCTLFDPEESIYLIVLSENRKH
ncbi:MAG TPA: class I SAM-dependent methyltransferase [Anaerolineales bacterium]|nr:class I SAM-dependent methyltransferase [Anaerolineales bacterium]